MPSEDIGFGFGDDRESDDGGDDEQGAASTRGSISGSIAWSICGSNISSVFLIASWKSGALVMGEGERSLGLGANTDTTDAFSVGDDTRQDVGESSVRFKDGSGDGLVVTVLPS